MFRVHYWTGSEGLNFSFHKFLSEIKYMRSGWIFVFQALSASWHPDCLTCNHCDQPVADKGFSKVVPITPSISEVDLLVSSWITASKGWWTSCLSGLRQSLEARRRCQCMQEVRSFLNISSYPTARILYIVYCRCHGTIDGTPLRWQGENFHPYHFNCTGCNVELTSSAREVGPKF